MESPIGLLQPKAAPIKELSRISLENAIYKRHVFYDGHLLMFVEHVTLLKVVRVLFLGIRIHLFRV